MDFPLGGPKVLTPRFAGSQLSAKGGHATRLDDFRASRVKDTVGKPASSTTTDDLLSVAKELKQAGRDPAILEFDFKGPTERCPLFQIRTRSTNGRAGQHRSRPGGRRSQGFEMCRGTEVGSDYCFLQKGDDRVPKGLRLRFPGLDGGISVQTKSRRGYFVVLAFARNAAIMGRRKSAMKTDILQRTVGI